MDLEGPAAARRYLKLTFDDMASLFAHGQGLEGGADEPARFLSYPTAPRYRLPRPPSAPLNAEAAATPDLLSAIFGYGYGLSGLEVGPGQGWPYHRFVASARCFFPTELYAWLDDGRKERIAYYDAAHHDLRLLREEPVRLRLEQAMGRSLPGAEAVLMVTSYFWKTAFRYRDYAYRLCTQEAGLVAGNLAVVAEQLGYRPRISYEFADGVVRSLLGLQEGLAATMAMIVLTRGTADVGPPVTGPNDDPAPTAATPHGAGLARLDQLPLMLHLDRSSERDEHQDFTPSEADAGECDGRSIPAPPGQSAPRDVFAALRSRHSGQPDFMPAPDPVTSVVLQAVHRAALQPTDTAAPLCCAYLVVNRVTGMRPGIYRCCSSCGGLHQVRDGSFGMRLQYAVYAPNVNACATPLVVYLTCGVERLIETIGDRAYRIANLDAGVTAQRISVAAAAHGCVARVSNGYHSDRVRALLELPDAITPIFQLLIAHPHPGIRYRFPLVTGGTL